ncbi:MAG: hypothetical protein JST62_08640 [Bacteroidetes bacterium]|jgi:transposase|nr:hypothetical protein [Bacteroidota bacterium]
MKKLILFISCSLSLIACGQQTKNNQNTKTIKTENKMDLTKLTNENVKKAIEALQANDKNAWFSYFANDVAFTDDGRTLDFKPFFDNAFNHKEKFLTIDKVENDGKNITGNFFAGQWGTFKVFFNFHQNADGKFNGLDIGQTK